MNKSVIHSVWIGNKLSLLEQLSIRLYQKHGYQVCIWLYDECSGIPSDVIIKDASLIMPKESIFQYNGIPNPAIHNGGIGSYSFWSDQFQMRLLYSEGGIYSQLDVMMISPMEFKMDTLFTHDGLTAQTCFMKLPKGSPYALAISELLEKTVNSVTMPRLQWTDSMMCIDSIIEQNHLEAYILSERYYQNGIHHHALAPNTDKIKIIHWCNSMLRINKDEVYKGSLYEQLLGECGLEGFKYTNVKAKNIVEQISFLPFEECVDQIQTGRMPLKWYLKIPFEGLSAKISRKLSIK